MLHNLNIAALEKLFVLLKNPIVDASEQIRLDGSDNSILAIFSENLVYGIFASKFGFQLFLEFQKLLLILEVDSCQHLSSLDWQHFF